MLESFNLFHNFSPLTEELSVYNFVLTSGVTLTVYGLWKFLSVLLRIYTSPLRDLPGPKNKSWIYGNLEEIRKADTSAMHERWTEEYGNVIVYKTIFCVSGKRFHSPIPFLLFGITDKRALVLYIAWSSVYLRYQSDKSYHNAFDGLSKADGE